MAEFVTTCELVRITPFLASTTKPDPEAVGWPPFQASMVTTPGARSAYTTLGSNPAVPGPAWLPGGTASVASWVMVTAFWVTIVCSTLSLPIFTPSRPAVAAPARPATKANTTRTKARTMPLSV